MFSITKMKAVWGLFQQGKACADPQKWKAHQVNSTMLGGLFIAAVQLAKAFGIDVPIDSDSATAIAAAIIAVVNIVLTITTSKHAGYVPTGASTEAQQAVPSVQPADGAAEAQETVRPVNSPNVEQTGITDDVIARARAWAAEHSKPAAGSTAFDSPTYYNP